MVDDHRIFIIHAREPFILAEVFHFDDDQEKEWMEAKSQFIVGSSVDYPGKLICIGAHFVSPCENPVEVLPKIMRRMGDWYHAYLIFEDNENK